MNRIAIYPGSFNPFHKGHENIVLKAADLFDIIIIAQGNNPLKSIPLQFDIPKHLQTKNIISDKYNISLSEYTKLMIKKYNEKIFIVRGLRNGYDLGYEEVLRKTLEDSIKEIKFVYLFCDREYEYISSSMIRQLKTVNEDVSIYLPEDK
jgi:pantetheine-phosphate adenylyltransferase